MTNRPVVAFLSDYGLADEFVGVCKAVMLGLAPELEIVDITHDLPPHDVRAGGLALVRAVQYLPDGAVVLAVVDPGVATDRRLVAVAVGSGTLVGPDNGLLAPAVAMMGGAEAVVAITNEEHQLPAPGPTFAGRDILAPAAAALATGTLITDLGPAVDPAGLVPGLVGLPQIGDGGAIDAEVWWVDRFGNCQLNLGPEELSALGGSPAGTVEVRMGSRVKSARWVHAYADAKPSELVLLVDSYGMLALALDRSSAAAEFGLRAGDPVTLVPPGATVADAGAPAP
ncbi:MAG: SAM-dependent chlorinase/fluorinase [Actinobacteria bacterium]|nr:SAM-dependent chlorinase/fluorinase [Actinomycetota bacterium]